MDYKPHFVCFTCRKTFKPKNATYHDVVHTTCSTCNQLAMRVSESFRAPKTTDKAGWALAQRLVTPGSFPEFSKAKRGTLAYFWTSRDGGLGCFLHIYESVYQKVWYPIHEREVPEWVAFMMSTSVLPQQAPMYTKAQRENQTVRGAPWIRNRWMNSRVSITG